MNAVEIKNLSKNFGPKQAVCGLNMTVPMGAIYGFIGENGSGKSTTEKMICGLIPTSGGSIKLYGKDYTDPAVQGFLYCNKLFEYERSYREKGLSFKQIYNRRLKDQKPVVEAFLTWLDKQKAPSGSRLARALTYEKNQEKYMMTYLEDGHCSISNNLSENSIRPVTVGRRNWLFCDTTDGADASMMAYSLLETARANGLNPQKYLEYLLEARPSKDMSDEEFETMAPWSPKVQECCVNQS